jgi:hypothetical protein
MAFENRRRTGGMTRRQRRLLVRLALAAAVATLIVTRYTSPRSLFNPVETNGAASHHR